jgi:hypothetical protein
MRNSFVVLGQISDPIFKLAHFLALWKATDNHVSAGRTVLDARGWPISNNLPMRNLWVCMVSISELRADVERASLWRYYCLNLLPPTVGTCESAYWHCGRLE